MEQNAFELDNLTAQQIDEFKSNSPVIFVGSAISIFPPTNLPTGMSVTAAIYDYLFPNLSPKYSWLRAEFNEFPFEALMNCFPKKEDLHGILKAIFRNKDSNLLHKALADRLICGDISGIVTPNYDMAFDNHLNCQGFYNIFKSKDDKILHPGGIYFKIHGCISTEELPICTLDQEEILATWRIELLKKMLKGRTLIMIGYSGRDFDICPIIKNKEEFDYDKIIWLKRNKSERLSAYAQYLLYDSDKSLGPNFIIEGDIVSFINKFFGGPEKLERADEPFKAGDYFKLDDAPFYLWRLKTLKELGACSITELYLDDSIKQLDKEFYNKMRYSHFTDKAQYKQAVEFLLSKLDADAQSPDSHLHALTFIGVSLRIYGDYKNADEYFKRAMAFLKEKFPNNDTREMSLLTKILVHHDYVSKTKCRPSRYLRDNCEKILAIIKRLRTLNMQGEGKLHEKQGNTIASKSLVTTLEKNHYDFGGKAGLISEARSFQKEIVSPLDSHDGFQNLGENIMAGVALRSFLKRKALKKEMTVRDTVVLKKKIYQVELLGLTPEIWKLSMCIVKYGILNKKRRLKYWQKWKAHLNMSQYSSAKLAYYRGILYWNLIWTFLRCR